MIDLDGLSTWHSTLEPDTPKAAANPLYSCVNIVALIRLRSNSASAETITITALPKGAQQSSSSRNDTSSIPGWSSLLSTSRKCRTPRATRSAAQTITPSNSPMGGGHHLIECRTLRPGAADPVAILVDDFKPSLLRQPPPSRACVSGF